MDVETQCGTVACSRWKALQTSMQGFLSENGTLARIGLATYPGSELVNGYICGATTDAQLRVPLPADEAEDDATLAGQASKVNEVLQGISSGGRGMAYNETGGGTPTNTSLRFVGELPALEGQTRANFILLLTDGLPNCNLEHPTPAPSPECRCTGSCSGQLSALGCLDKDGSVATIQALRQKGIKTIVIGFGAETAAGDGPGGFARECPAGGTDCQRFYQASNQTELAQALKEIIDLVGEGDPCVLPLQPEQRPTVSSLADGGEPPLAEGEKMMVVYINDESLLPGADTWNLTEVGVQFNGATCERIKNSTTANPVNIQVRVVRRR
jgi:hypothetical protein